jgi:hypothetical protein
LYWVNSAGYINYYPFAGPALVTLASGMGELYRCCVDATNVYVADYAGNAIKKAKLSDGTKTTLASSQTGVFFLDIDGLYVYWGTADGYVRKVPIATGTVITLASGYTSPRAVAVDTNNCYFLDRVAGLATGGVYKIYANPFASGAHTWLARTKVDIIFDAANKQIITSNFATGNGTTTGDAAYTTTGGIIYLGQDSAGANQLDGLISEPRLWV